MPRRQNRSEPISLRLSPEELALVKRQAEAEGIGLSELMRRRALQRSLVERGAPWSGRWGWYDLYPRNLGGDRPEGHGMALGNVYLDDEGLALLDKLAEAAWFTCFSCYGTGYRDYKSSSGAKPKPGDCPKCHGWGVVQAREWRARREKAAS